MKVGLISDVHLEMYEDAGKVPVLEVPDDLDLMIFAGDIAVGADGLEWIAQCGVPSLYVLGNHEFYHGEYFEVLERVRLMAKDYDNITVLEGEYVDIDGVRFLGGVTWTDFNLNGAKDTDSYFATKMMSDFRVIRFKRDDTTKKLRPEDTMELHRQQREFLSKNTSDTLTNVVISHHLPSKRSVPPQFTSSMLNPAFASDLESVMRLKDVSFWFHGHSHDGVNYQVGKCNVASNPIGYFNIEQGDLVIRPKVFDIS